MRTNRKSRAAAGIGTLTMLFGALLVIAPAASAAVNDNANDNGRRPIDVPGPVTPDTPPAPIVADPGSGEEDGGNNDIEKYWVELVTDEDDTDDVVIENPVFADGKTTYSYVIGGVEGESLSHATVAAFCQTPIGYTAEQFGAYDGSTGVNGLNIPAPAVGQVISFVFEGDLMAMGPEASVWVLKKGNVDGGDKEFKISGPTCSTAKPTELPDLTVVKKVVDAPTGMPPAFQFASTAGTFDAKLGHDGTKTFPDVAKSTYTISEVAGDDYLTAVKCNGQDMTVVRSGELRTVTVEVGNDVTCIFTNTFVPGEIIVEDPNPATVVIREVVIGTPAEKVPSGWAFGFSANSTDAAADVSAAARKIFELGETDPETTFTVEPGSSLNVAQDEVPTVDGGVWSFLGTACEGADDDDVTAAGQAVTVTPDADDVITCTFTTEFTALEVAPSPGPRPSPAPAPVPTPKPVVTPPTPAPVPAPKATPTPKPTEVLGETVTRTPAAPAPAVLGVQTTRLANTGSGSFGLAGFGLMLLTLGGALVAASRLGRLGEG